MATSMMHELLNTKIQMHIELCNDEGISERDLFETKEDPATTAYLSYLENVGNSGDFIDMMAVLSPSFLGYAEIGAYLGAKKMRLIIKNGLMLMLARTIRHYVSTLAP